MEIYDIIHGNIAIDPLSKQIIDTDEFQRLRNIKQLGCCNYVFPSAVHTRFEHSIGVYHLSKKYIDILNTNDQFTVNDIKCITIGALIHDIGHGPYSHLFDELVNPLKNHEYRSIELLKYMKTKYELDISDEDIIKISNIIHPVNQIGKNFIYQIVSNQNGIDVDRFDYIMRDIKMTGLNYGIEYERIMDNSSIQNGEIVFSEKVKTSIDEFFRIRFIMYKEVYNHHTVRAIEFMMKDYIKGIDSFIHFTEKIDNNQWDDFNKLDDSITNILYYIQIDNDKEKDDKEKDDKEKDDKEKDDKEKDDKEYLLSLIKNIKSRNIYKSIGEIITDSKLTLKGYNEEHLIVDTIKLSFYGKEECNYVQSRNIINKSLMVQNNDKYITSIYYKSDLYRDEAIRIFNKLK
jgi:HD superfamily phosphohydrolase